MIPEFSLVTAGLVLVASIVIRLDSIPAIGPSGVFSSYLGAYTYLRNAPKIVQEGYTKVGSCSMDLPEWLYELFGSTNPACSSRDEDLSAVLGFGAVGAQREFLPQTTTLGPAFVTNDYHVKVIQSSMTRSITARFADIKDEGSASDLSGLSALSKGRDPGYRNLTVEFANGVMASAKRINLLPPFFGNRQIFGPFLSNLSRDLARAKKHLVPIIEERLKLEDEHGPNWSERPSFTQALYHLAQSPEYVAPLREELKATVLEEGWTKSAMSKCAKLDSFSFRESQRFNGASAVNINRIVINPAGFTFSDGTPSSAGDIPRGCDARNTPRRDELRESRYDRGSIKLQMVAPDVKYLSFGLGRHACPGRFFAVNELKLMLAHILENYDVKLEGPTRPPTEWFGTMAGANQTAKVLFRRRVGI
ncbi:cytochrome P450 [Mycena olivaceomarginata]|nr:cytochrome P450 [Mycena olivaceomarginata]